MDILRKSSETGDIFLYMEDTRIGTLSSFDEETGEYVFDLLVDKTLPISKEKLIEYICNAVQKTLIFRKNLDINHHNTRRVNNDRA